MSLISRRQALQWSVAGWGLTVGRGQAGTVQPLRTFHFDHVLGTSLDGWFRGTAADAVGIELLVLDEIERLRRIFSVYDPASELSRWNATGDAIELSSELTGIIARSEQWNRRCGGVLDPRVGHWTTAWREAARTGGEIDERFLQREAPCFEGPAWTRVGSRFRRQGSAPLDFNAFAKGFILDRCLAVIQAAMPSIAEFGIDLGGDIRTAGPSALVAIQDPLAPAANADPIAIVALRDAAIATSGGYERSIERQGIRRSHLINPRTGRSADTWASATAIAPTSGLANVLATTLCLLDERDGLALVRSLPGTACLLVDPAGRMVRSDSWSIFHRPRTVPVGRIGPEEISSDEARADEKPWPADYQVTVAIELPKMGGKYRRPYVAVWMENEDGKAVRTVSVWGNQPRWIGELSGWWKFARDDQALVKAVSRATRGPGKYSVIWDGKDNAGKALPQGRYTVKVEVHREHGKHVTQTGTIACLDKAATVQLAKNAETEETVVTFDKAPPAGKK